MPDAVVCGDNANYVKRLAKDLGVEAAWDTTMVRGWRYDVALLMEGSSVDWDAVLPPAARVVFEVSRRD